MFSVFPQFLEKVELQMFHQSNSSYYVEEKNKTTTALHVQADCNLHLNLKNVKNTFVLELQTAVVV